MMRHDHNGSGPQSLRRDQLDLGRPLDIPGQNQPVSACANLQHARRIVALRGCLPARVQKFEANTIMSEPLALGASTGLFRLPEGFARINLHQLNSLCDRRETSSVVNVCVRHDEVIERSHAAPREIRQDYAGGGATAA